MERVKNKEYYYKAVSGLDYLPSTVDSSLSPSGINWGDVLRGVDLDNRDVCRELMSKIKWSYLSADQRLAKLINDKVRVNERKKAKIRVQDDLFVHHMTGALFHPLVSRSLPSPLSAFSDVALHVLLCCWVLTKGNDKVFSTENIVKFKSYDFQRVSKELTRFEEMGIIDRLNDVQVHKWSGKFVPRGRGVGRAKAYFRLNRKGVFMLKGYFEAYKKTFEKIMGEMFAVDLLASLDGTNELQDNNK